MALPTQRPTSSWWNYFKFKAWPNRVRFVWDLIWGESVWDKSGEKPRVLRSKEAWVLTNLGDQKVKTFWAGLVFNRDDDNTLQLIELDKASIINALINLDGNADWGDITKYDITIDKQVPANPLNTKYVVTPIPPKALTAEELATIKATPVDLDNMFVEDASVFLDSDDEVGWDVDDDAKFGEEMPNAVASEPAPVAPAPTAPVAPPLP